MTHIHRKSLVCLFFVLLLVPFARLAAQESIPDDFETLFEERAKSVVAVEMFVQNEIDREPVGAAGVVFDGEGRIILLDGAIPSWLPPERFKDIRVRPLGEDVEGFKARYLGQDFLTGYHFIQLEEGLDSFVPITTWGRAELKRGQFLWGIAVMSKAWHFMPYYLSSRLSAVEKLPGSLALLCVRSARPGRSSLTHRGASPVLGTALQRRRNCSSSAATNSAPSACRTCARPTPF